MKNQLTFAGGLLTIVSMFLPIASILGVSVRFMDKSKGVGYFWIACGLIIAIVSFLDKKKLNYLSLIFWLLITCLSVKYYNDLNGAAGLGILLMMTGGVLSILGSVKGLRNI